MKVCIEQELYGDGRITLGDLRKFVDAVEASTNDFLHPELQTIEIRTYGIVYEKEND
ncbi:hypothetical protein ACFC1L_39745 [Streptomyces sp. NPDC056210]|uniref:hypothetical protein n=1 Tax=Streptomyces sp. NPDC056210 TaxID=3345746 RepID=UPI0035D9B53E